MLQRLFVLALLVIGGLCGPVAVAAPCPTGLTNCAGACVDLKTSTDHCGACGVKVETPYTCASGRRTLTCPSTQLACGNKVCATPSSDPNNCGGCGIQCARDEVCTLGSCTLPCPSGQTQCGRECRDTRVDWTHCGTCGKRCGTGERCSAGKCVGVCIQIDEQPVEKPPVEQYKLRR